MTTRAYGAKRNLLNMEQINQGQPNPVMDYFWKHCIYISRGISRKLGIIESTHGF